MPTQHVGRDKSEPLRMKSLFGGLNFMLRYMEDRYNKVKQLRSEECNSKKKTTLRNKRKKGAITTTKRDSTEYQLVFDLAGVTAAVALLCKQDKSTRAKVLFSYHILILLDIAVNKLLFEDSSINALLAASCCICSFELEKYCKQDLDKVLPKIIYKLATGVTRSSSLYCNKQQSNCPFDLLPPESLHIILASLCTIFKLKGGEYSLIKSAFDSNHHAFQLFLENVGDLLNIFSESRRIERSSELYFVTSSLSILLHMTILHHAADDLTLHKSFVEAGIIKRLIHILFHEESHRFNDREHGTREKYVHKSIDKTLILTSDIITLLLDRELAFCSSTSDAVCSEVLKLDVINGLPKLITSLLETDGILFKETSLIVQNYKLKSALAILSLVCSDLSNGKTSKNVHGDAVRRSSVPIKFETRLAKIKAASKNSAFKGSSHRKKSYQSASHTQLLQSGNCTNLNIYGNTIAYLRHHGILHVIIWFLIHNDIKIQRYSRSILVSLESSKVDSLESSKVDKKCYKKHVKGMSMVKTWETILIEEGCVPILFGIRQLPKDENAKNQSVLLACQLINKLRIYVLEKGPNSIMSNIMGSGCPVVQSNVCCGMLLLGLSKVEGQGNIFHWLWGNGAKVGIFDVVLGLIFQSNAYTLLMRFFLTLSEMIENNEERKPRSKHSEFALRPEKSNVDNLVDSIIWVKSDRSPNAIKMECPPFRFLQLYAPQLAAKMKEERACTLNYKHANDITIQTSSYEAAEEFMIHITGVEKIESDPSFNYDLSFSFELLELSHSIGSHQMQRIYAKNCSSSLGLSNVALMMERAIDIGDEWLTYESFSFIIKELENTVKFYQEKDIPHSLFTAALHSFFSRLSLLKSTISCDSCLTSTRKFLLMSHTNYQDNNM